MKSEDVMGGLVRCNGGGIAGNSCTLTPAHQSTSTILTSTTKLTSAHQWPTKLTRALAPEHQHHSHVGEDPKLEIRICVSTNTAIAISIKITIALSLPP